jgi:hypothetical protein
MYQNPLKGASQMADVQATGEPSEGAGGTKTFAEHYRRHGGEWIQTRLEELDRDRDAFGLRRPDPTEGDIAAKLQSSPIAHSVLAAAPNLSTTTPGAHIEHLLHSVPSTRWTPTTDLNPGDPMPDFEIIGSGGERVTLADLRGKPFAIRLTRGGTGMI